MFPKKKAVIFIAAFFCLWGCAKSEPYSRDFVAMDTFIRISIKDSIPEEAKDKAAGCAAQRMMELTRKFDFFSPESELSRINSLAGAQKLDVSEEMHVVLSMADDIKTRTGGAFDVACDSSKRIDLGGIAKGFIVDEGAKALKDCGIKDALVDAGGDMYCMGGLWTVGVRDPRDRRKIIAFFTVNGKGVATSGNYERPGHITDPRTGNISEKPFKSATVVAGNCMTADALATALYVLEPAEGLELIEKMDGAECVIINGNGEFFVSSGLKKSLRPAANAQPVEGLTKSHI